MEAPDGRQDLIADAEDALRRQEEELARTRAEVERLRNGAEVIDVDGMVVAPAPEPWKHETIEFAGEEFEVRKPQPQALAAFSLASGKYIPQQMQNDMVGLFIRQHMSETSHARVYERMMDPEDPEFTPSTLGDLMRRIATLGTSRPTAPSRP